MYKNQLQELAQRSCFNLPAYTCIREGPDHAPRFKAVVNFNGENFESPAFCTTLRQAEHAAAEVALGALSKQGPSRSLAARVLDETGVYKNLLQETAHRAGLNLPVYTTVRSGPGHTPVFTCTVELAGISFMGDPAKTKKQAQKNAALAAWSVLKQLSHMGSSSSIKSSESNEQQEQVVVARSLAKLCSLGVSKQSPSNEWQCDRRKMASTRDNMNLASDASLNSGPVPYQSWTSSNILLEIETYESGHQEHSPLFQSHLLGRPSPIHCSESRNLQHMQPIIQSDQAQYFPLSEQDNLDSLTCFAKTPSSSLFFSGYPSVPPGDQVSLLETQEDNGVRRNAGWLGSGISDVSRDPIHQRTNFLSNPMMYSSYEGSSHTLSVDRSAEFKFQELLKNRQGYPWSNLADMSSEEKNRNPNSGFFPMVPSGCDPFSFLDSGAGRNNQEISQCEIGMESFDWSHSGQTISRPSSPTHSMFGSTQSVHNVQSRSLAACTLALNRRSEPLNLSPQCSSRATMPVLDAFRTRDSFLSSPVNIRTAIPVCSARRGCSSPYASQANSVAPAVHVRSVAPVCSAPSTRRIQSTKIMHEQEELSTQMGRFGKLRI